MSPANNKTIKEMYRYISERHNNKLINYEKASLAITF